MIFIWIYSDDDDSLHAVIRKGILIKLEEKDFLILLYLTGNIRSILGISNINESTEVKADRYPQYEVDKYSFLYKIWIFLQ